jgi:hypothetical protein
MLIWGKREAIYFCARDWTDSITLNGREKFVFARMCEWRERGPFHGASPTPPRPCRTAASTSRRPTRRFLFRERAAPVEYSACLNLAIERGWLELHESGTFVRFTQAGANRFA